MNNGESYERDLEEGLNVNSKHLLLFIEIAIHIEHILKIQNIYSSYMFGGHLLGAF